MNAFKKMLKAYLSQPCIYLYMAFAALALYVCRIEELFPHYWPFFFLPILVAPFYEWVLHKFVLHRLVTPDHKGAYRYQKKLHYDHHIDPNNRPLIFAPISAAIFVFVQIFLLFTLIGWDWRAGFAGMTTAIIYFLYYEWVHLGHHVAGYDHLTPYGKFMKKAHLWHHYSNDNYWWGITSHFGDLAFGTFPEVKSTPQAHLLPEYGKTP